jgi:hypothetical protein
MKTSFTALSISMVAAMACSQGAVDLVNGAQNILITAGPVDHEALISGPPGSYYFGLLVAPTGTADPSLFSFAEVYATNRGSMFPGQLRGGFDTATGWGTGVTMSYLVAGWSSSLGHDWNKGWLGGSFGSAGFFGLSTVASGTAGGPSGGVPFVAWPLFETSVGITTGWNLAPVPEPSSASIAALGVLTLMLYRTSRPTTPNPRSALDAGFVSCLHTLNHWPRASESERSAEWATVRLAPRRQSS